MLSFRAVFCAQRSAFAPSSARRADRASVRIAREARRALVTSSRIELSTFEAVREATGWQRPCGDHGCIPVQILPGLWNAHYHDVDSAEKLRRVAPGVRLVVNTAPAQCAARTGDLGAGVTVCTVDLEDDPDARKAFDAGKPATSSCAQPDVPLHQRCAGSAKRDFERVLDAIRDELQPAGSGGEVLIHCHASLSRSIAFVLAYLMREEGMTLVGAVQHTRARWRATWPNDRFIFQLLEYERELRAPPAVRQWLQDNPSGV